MRRTLGAERHRRNPLDGTFCCPVCQLPLHVDSRTLKCPLKHTYDVAKEGYVNLLLPQHRKSSDPGYNAQMIRARNVFFRGRHYERLADSIATTITLQNNVHVMVDAGCGEGYYLRRIRQLYDRLNAYPRPSFSGIDISKHGIKTAAKLDRASAYAVASSYRMPFDSSALDCVLSHFSPVPIKEFCRILRPYGTLVIGSPGPTHLSSLRQLLYEESRSHSTDEVLARNTALVQLSEERVRYDVDLTDPDQIRSLLLMTPYYWAASPQTQDKITSLNHLHTEVDVYIRVYQFQAV